MIKGKKQKFDLIRHITCPYCKKVIIGADKKTHSILDKWKKQTKK